MTQTKNMESKLSQTQTQRLRLILKVCVRNNGESFTIYGRDYPAGEYESSYRQLESILSHVGKVNIDEEMLFKSNEVCHVANVYMDEKGDYFVAENNPAQSAPFIKVFDRIMEIMTCFPTCKRLAWFCKVRSTEGGLRVYPNDVKPKNLLLQKKLVELCQRSRASFVKTLTHVLVDKDNNFYVQFRDHHRSFGQQVLSLFKDDIGKTNMLDTDMFPEVSLIAKIYVKSDGNFVAKSGFIVNDDTRVALYEQIQCICSDMGKAHEGGKARDKTVMNLVDICFDSSGLKRIAKVYACNNDLAPEKSLFIFRGHTKSQQQVGDVSSPLSPTFEKLFEKVVKAVEAVLSQVEMLFHFCDIRSTNGENRRKQSSLQKGAAHTVSDIRARCTNKTDDFFGVRAKHCKFADHKMFKKLSTVCRDHTTSQFGLLSQVLFDEDGDFYMTNKFPSELLLLRDRIARLLNAPQETVNTVLVPAKPDVQIGQVDHAVASEILVEKSDAQIGQVVVPEIIPAKTEAAIPESVVAKLDDQADQVVVPEIIPAKTEAVVPEIIPAKTEAQVDQVVIPEIVPAKFDPSVVQAQKPEKIFKVAKICLSTQGSFSVFRLEDDPKSSNVRRQLVKICSDLPKVDTGNVRFTRFENELAFVHMNDDEDVFLSKFTAKDNDFPLNILQSSFTLLSQNVHRLLKCRTIFVVDGDSFISTWRPNLHSKNDDNILPVEAPEIHSKNDNILPVKEPEILLNILLDCIKLNKKDNFNFLVNFFRVDKDAATIQSLFLAVMSMKYSDFSSKLTFKKLMDDFALLAKQADNGTLLGMIRDCLSA